MEVWKKIVSYVTFRPQEHAEGQERNFNLKAMHFINKLSLLMFLIGLIVLIIRWSS